jgi:hypothetical protein
MTEPWQPARLIPTSGISGTDEQETRATSALLAVLPVVRDFGLGLLRPLGAKAGVIESYIEVPLVTADGRTVRPDGLVKVTRGQTAWSTLVEVKTGANDLKREQLETYLDLARDNGFDAVLTISNQMVPAPGVHPVDVDKRKLRKVQLHHLSWAEVVSAAIIQRVHHGVSDPEQAWILAELIRYLQHPRSGAMDFSEMGAAWIPTRDAITAGTLRSNDKGINEVVIRWDQLLRFAAIRLERELGSGVQLALARREDADPTIRTATLVSDLVDRGCLTGTLRVPNTVGDLHIEADLRTNRCTVSVEFPAPSEGRALTRVNWLLRQLADAPGALRVDAYAHMARTSTSELLSAVREKPILLLADPKVDLRRFRVAAASQLGAKRGVGRGSFIDAVLAALDGFYELVLQALRPWVAKAPQLPKSGSAVADAGIDTSVLPDEQVVAVEDDPSTTNGDAEVVGPVPTDGNAAESTDDDGADASEFDERGIEGESNNDDRAVSVDELVSWDAQVDEIEHERSAADQPNEGSMSQPSAQA